MPHDATTKKATGQLGQVTLPGFTGLRFRLTWPFLQVQQVPHISNIPNSPKIGKGDVETG